MTTPPLWLLFDPSGQPREYWTKPPTVEELRSLGERQWRVVRYEATDDPQRTRVVFLDFDGVLNSHTYVRSLSEDERGGVIGIDANAVSRLNRLLRETGAEVVVSSTWRHGRTVPQLANILRAAGFDGTVRGATPQWLTKSPGGVYSAQARGEEIQAWLDAAPRYAIDVESFVILDDDSDMAHLGDRLVKTSFDDGLRDDHVDRAIEMLTKPPPIIIQPTVEAVVRFTT